MKSRIYLNNPNKTPLFKRNYFFLILLVLFSFNSFSQVGINNTDPKSALDISASDASDPSSTDGILIPKIDKFPDTDPGADQHSMIAYLTTTDGSDDPGFYYWNINQTKWIAMGYEVAVDTDTDTNIEYIDELLDGKSDVDGSENGSSIFLGIDAGAADDSSDNKNVGIGYQSLNAVITGANNTAIGYQTGQLITGSSNTAIGSGALDANTTGSNSTAIGYNTLSSTTTTGGNTAIGKDAMSSGIGSTGNVAIGVNALELTETGGNSNVSIGNNSMVANTSGLQNVAIGTSALRANTTGGNNMALGAFSLRYSTVGEGHTAVGPYALNKYVGASTEKGNTAVGNITMNALTSGGGNVAIGFESFRFGTSGEDNTMVGKFSGFQAGRDGTTIDDNTFVGSSSGFGSTGSRNTFIGNSAGGYFDDGDGDPATDGDNTYTTGSDNIFIGYNAGDNVTAASISDKLIIENSNSTSALIYGEFDNDQVGINWTSGTALPNTLSVNGNASKSSSGSWLANSDRRLKKDIETISPNKALDKITSLRGVTYKWNDTKTGIERSKKIQYGFIAQELMEVFPEKVTKDGLGFYQTAYGDYDALFVQAFKELKTQLVDKDQRINELENQVKELQLLTERIELIEAKLNLKEENQVNDSE